MEAGLALALSSTSVLFSGPAWMEETAKVTRTGVATLEHALPLHLLLLGKTSY